LITPAQSRAARGLLSITQTELARAAGLGPSTVIDFERERRVVAVQSVNAVRAALEAAGVIFLEENGEGPGVRLKKADP
jgi:transcriptional regulator with XRE-family HTH domain